MMRWLRTILNRWARMAAFKDELDRKDGQIAAFQQAAEANIAAMKAYRLDMQEQSAELVRLRRALERVRAERNDWRDRALGYRQKIVGGKGSRRA